MSDSNYDWNNTYGDPLTGEDSSAPNRGLAVLCYLFTWVGFIIAFVAGDRNDPYFKHHLNQALVLHLFSMIGLIPFIGWVWGIFMFVMYVLAVMSAIKETTEPVPVFGGIHLL